MNQFPKLFIKAGLIYLVMGVVLGILIGIMPELSGRLRFVHIHLNLLGFMTMMIAGVAYHVLPRFSSRTLPWPTGTKYHFILQNVGLVGMLAAHLGGGFYTSGLARNLFILFAVMTAVGLLIMAYNLYFVLSAPEASPAPTKITPDMKVGDALDHFPQALEVFLQNGFDTLANPVARNTFAKVITIGAACEKHGVDVAEFMVKLNTALFQKPESASPPSPASENAPAGTSINKGEYCRPDVMVGRLIKAYPETKAVFEKHYGEGCFTCPGQAFETVHQTAQMHNVDTDMILKEINTTIESVLGHSTQNRPSP